MKHILCLVFALNTVAAGCCFAAEPPETLPDTKPIEWLDVSDKTGENYCVRNTRLITEFLDRKTAESEAGRAKYWQRDFSSADAYNQSVEKNRERLKFITGIRDKRVSQDSQEWIRITNPSSAAAETETHTVRNIRWKVFDDFTAECLHYEPKSGKADKTIIYLSNLGGRKRPLKKDEQMFVPVLLDRSEMPHKAGTLQRREWIYRQAYQVGRHIIGYEVQEVLALVDWLKHQNGNSKIAVEGQADGGLIALYAAAVDTRIDECCVIDYFTNRDRMCEEPLDRNVFGLLKEFGDAEIASLICPRKLTVVLTPQNQPLTLPENNPWSGGSKSAPGKIKKLLADEVVKEIERAKKLTAPLKTDWITFTTEKDETAKPLPAQRSDVVSQDRIVKQLERHTQHLLTLSQFARRDFWKKLDTKSPQRIAETIEWYRKYFSENVVGEFEEPFAPLNARTKLFRDCENYTVYAVELDVFDGLTAFGLLMIPKKPLDSGSAEKAGGKYPAIVAQHGLEVDVKHHIREFSIDDDDSKMMNTKLCRGGYVTFCPQGIFKGGNKFRYNQRQLNPLGKNLFAVMTAQEKQIVRFLQTLPMVDKEKIGFYGCSYGGTTAMFCSPLIPEYKAVVCSANFNYWNYRTVAVDSPMKTYIYDGQYEIYDFNLANTFDHSDMVRLIAPRAFCVERGHFDGVALDEYVGYEWGKVRFYYDVCVKEPDKAVIVFMPHGHLPYVTPILPFLDRWLKQQP